MDEKKARCGDNTAITIKKMSYGWVITCKSAITTKKKELWRRYPCIIQIFLVSLHL